MEIYDVFSKDVDFFVSVFFTPEQLSLSLQTQDTVKHLVFEWMSKVLLKSIGRNYLKMCGTKLPKHVVKSKKNGTN